MFSSVMTSAVARATSYEALLLISLASLARNSGREKGKFDIKELMTKMEGIASASGDMQYMPNLAFGDLLGLLNQFAEVCNGLVEDLILYAVVNFTYQC